MLWFFLKKNVFAVSYTRKIYFSILGDQFSVKIIYVSIDVISKVLCRR